MSQRVETSPPPSNSSRPTAQAAPLSRPRPDGTKGLAPPRPEQTRAPAPSPVAEAVYATKATAEQILELVQPGGGTGQNPLQVLADTLEAILTSQRQIHMALRELDAKVEAIRRGR